MMVYYMDIIDLFIIIKKELFVKFLVVTSKCCHSPVNHDYPEIFQYGW